MANENKVTIQKLYDEIIPLLKDLNAQGADIANIKEDVKDIKIDMKCKISSRAFSAWLSALAVAIGIITTILFLVK